MEATDKTSDIDETVEQLRSGAHSVVDKAANTTKQTAEQLNQKGEQWHEAEQQYLEQCRGYIHQQPFKALAIAVGAGFLLSHLLSDR